MGPPDGVWAVQWSVSNEWVLVTGGCDGAIRFWDIRQAGSFQVLDQHNSQIGRRPPVLKRSPQKSDQVQFKTLGIGFEPWGLLGDVGALLESLEQ